MTEAKDAKPGRIYRRTRRGPFNDYYIVPKKLTAKNFVQRLRERGTAISGRDQYLIHLYEKCPSLVLVQVYMRCYDMQGNRLEVKQYALVPPDLHFRAVKTKPGYQ